jgi:hypothetical protein
MRISCSAGADPAQSAHHLWRECGRLTRVRAECPALIHQAHRTPGGNCVGIVQHRAIAAISAGQASIMGLNSRASAAVVPSGLRAQDVVGACQTLAFPCNGSDSISCGEGGQPSSTPRGCCDR